MNYPRMRKTLLASIIITGVAMHIQPASAALAPDAVLSFDAGEAVYDVYYGTIIGVTSGSYFAIDFNANGIFTDNEKTAIAPNVGLRLGAAQPASGSHPGAPDGSESPSIDMPWLFFGNTGMHQTLTPVTVTGGDDGDGDGVASLDMSGLGFTWNGIPNVPMGGDPANFPDTGIATLSCESSCETGEAFTMDYFAHVPVGDPSGFGGVFYTLHLEGTILDGTDIPPTSAISINLPAGTDYECIAGGASVNAVAQVTTSDPADILNISWTLDGTAAGNGESINVFADVGDHTLALHVDTQDSGQFDEMASFVVADTTVPDISAAFIDPVTGSEITVLDSNGRGARRVGVSYAADDACEGPVTASAILGLSIDNGSEFKVKRGGDRLSLEGVGEDEPIELSVTATDSSGNSAQASKQLH